MIISIINMIKKISKYNYKNTFKKTFNNLDDTVKHILKNGLFFCSIIEIIALIILVTYILYLKNPILFNIGFNLFRLSLIFSVEFIICGFAADKVKNELI